MPHFRRFALSLSLCSLTLIACQPAPTNPNAVDPSPAPSSEPANPPTAPETTAEPSVIESPPAAPATPAESASPASPEPTVQPSATAPVKLPLEAIQRQIAGRVEGFENNESVHIRVEVYRPEESRRFEVPLKEDGTYHVDFVGEERFLPVRIQAVSRLDGAVLRLSQHVQIEALARDIQSSEAIVIQSQDLPFEAISSEANKARVRVEALGTVTLTGSIFDDRGVPLPQAELEIRSRSTEFPFIRKLTASQQGKYREEVPPGLLYDIVAQRETYSKRSQVLQLAPGKAPQILDFGSAANQNPEKAVFALTQQPEVISANIAPNAMGVDVRPQIILGFDRPIQSESFEAGFVLEASKSIKFTVDQGNLEEFSFIGADLISSGLTKLHWTIQDFDAVWNAEHTQVTLDFKTGRQLPSDGQSGRLPEYQLRFITPVKSEAGVARTLPPFALKSGELRKTLPFKVARDTIAPRLEKLEFQPGELVDRFVFTFSEPMALSHNDLYFDAGMAQVHEARPLAAGGYSWRFRTGPEAVAVNYNFVVSDFGNKEFFDGTAQLLDGKAIYDPANAHRVIIEFPPSARENWVSGRKLLVNLLDTISDPAGNRIDLGHRKAEYIFP